MAILPPLRKEKLCSFAVLSFRQVEQIQYYGTMLLKGERFLFQTFITEVIFI